VKETIMTDDTSRAQHDHTHGEPPAGGLTRRHALACMAWAGTGLVWTLAGGLLSSRTLGQAAAAPLAPGQSQLGDFSFVQISDTHIGFKGAANPDVMATLHLAIAKINALQPAPAFLLHTGDLTHSQKAGAFDTLAEALKEVKTSQVFYVPGEHDVFADGGKEFLNRYGQGTTGNGWQSFDYQGVHFIGLVNVLNFKAAGLGSLGQDQLDWLKNDVARLSSSTSLVLFTHIPLWAVYPTWGWVTEDGEQALAMLKRFGSVTVLNGHIHQILQKVEGRITFHTAMSTAFPQPAPGAAPSPGPLQVPAEQLHRVLGIRDVRYVQGQQALALVETPLG
jgi:3',5'-cyclic-AMP phosphodiesterase